jgi:ferredoxin--NADP+ reductase
MIRRAFCITSESRPGEYLEFYLTLILSGELTPRLFNLNVGDRLYVGPRAEGIFTLDKSSSKNVLMIGTGTGLAPYMSMIRGELGVGHNGRQGLRAVWQCNGSRQFVIVHGARHSWDLGYRTELTALSRHCSNFHYLPVVTRPQEDETWRGRTGYIQDLINSDVVERETGLDVTPEHFEVFLCGNPGMIDSVFGWAEARGFTRDKGQEMGTIHAVKFW